MAKSIRSKRRRKMRAIKRVRYAAKELERLKKTLGINSDAEMKDVIGTELNDVTTVVKDNVIEFGFKEKKEDKAEKKPRIDVSELKIGEAEALLREDEHMDVVSEKDMKKLRGKFPGWMNQRQIQKMARSVKRNKKKFKRLEKRKGKK